MAEEATGAASDASAQQDDLEPDDASDAAPWVAGLDALYTETALEFLAITSSLSPLGSGQSIQSGKWVSETATEMSISLDLDGDALDLVERALPQAEAGILELDDLLSGGFRYRFFLDGFVWAQQAGGPWTRLDAATSGLADVEGAGDPLVQLEPVLLGALSWSDRSTDSDGSTTYDVTFDADAFMPLIALPSTAGNLYDAGWDGISAATLDGYVIVDVDGFPLEVGLDQTPWWEAGWAAVGTAAELEGTTVSWRYLVHRGSAISVEQPCADPIEDVSDVYGDVLRCP